MRRKKVTIGIVDDDRRYMTSLAGTLELVNDFRVVFTEPKPTEALRRISEWCPDIVIIDLAMPQKDGFTLLREIRADHSLRGLKVLIHTIHADKEYIDESVVASRANGYMVKGATRDLVMGIRYIVNDEHDPYISAPSEFPIFDENNLTPLYNVKLSPVLLDTARSMVKGHSYDEIASIIGRSKNTVDRNVSRLKERFGYDKTTFGVDFRVLLYLYLTKHKLHE
jgi:DNA-binding NarL/FixJ family response regulator